MITLEYVLIKGKNDSLKDADELAKIAKKLKAKVNLVPCSTIPELNFQSTGRRNIDIFMNRLINRGVNATLRESKGKDIQAACGQLAGRARG
jgi:23S rRNA (adenine2503-C2)-methyltransferase